MAQHIYTASIAGIAGAIVTVEADTVSALPSFTIVGLPDTAVQEARERIRAAIKNSGYTFPRLKVIVNLAPADLRKEGAAYDVPIAVAILLAGEALRGRITDPELLNRALFVGELALSGDVRPIHGMLTIALAGMRGGKQYLFCPAENAREARLVPDVTIIPIPSLRACIAHCIGEQTLPTYDAVVVLPDNAALPAVDFSDIVGNEHAKRALLVAASGNHNVVMTGAPGSGKTMLARALAGIMPAMTNAEMLSVTQIWSIMGLLPVDVPYIAARPFRDPHHSSSLVSLVGGGANPRPGEVSLAHHGVLFLDEFAEFPRSVLESLRQPLESGQVTIARANDHVTFPARFLLVAARNPCPCGYLHDPARPCTCAPGLLTRYQNKISGPLLDRIDLHIDVPRLPVSALEGEGGVSSAQLRADVTEARERQAARFSDCSWTVNADMPSAYLRRSLTLADDARMLLRNAVTKYHLSGRVYFRMMKVARTIADLAKNDTITVLHIAEALQYRFREDRAQL